MVISFLIDQDSDLVKQQKGEPVGMYDADKIVEKYIKEGGGIDEFIKLFAKTKIVKPFEKYFKFCYDNNPNNYIWDAVTKKLRLSKEKLISETKKQTKIE